MIDWPSLLSGSVKTRWQNQAKSFKGGVTLEASELTWCFNAHRLPEKALLHPGILGELKEGLHNCTFFYLKFGIVGM